MRHAGLTCAAVMVLVLAAACGGAPKPPAGVDADTAAWWSITGDLSGDDMEGRDTGSPGHDRAAQYVQERFAAAGLKPAGDNGGWRQTIPMKEARVDSATFDIVRDGGGTASLRFLHDVGIRATADLPGSIDAPLAFRGYCSPQEIGTDVSGKVLVCFSSRREGLPSNGDRLLGAAAVGAVGLMNVDDPGFTIEPARWPDAYARSVTFRNAPPPAHARFVVMRLAAEELATVIDGSGRDAAQILRDGTASRPLPAFDIPARIKVSIALSRRELQSDNVLGLLPGTDPVIGKEVVIVSAHLDGYGFGTPVDGDALYNGAFDDAAYVATLIRLAERQAGKGFRRSVLFAVYTGEEKGLLGSNWFAQELTVPKTDLAAVINLDQLRPLFPLKILTMHAIDDTTLKQNVLRVAGGMGIEIRPDMEPERNLNQRTDHWPFLRMGVPATNFVFGFDPGTDAERRYREWYRSRYHRPQDDMGQPLDWGAARDMNTFFYRLTEDVANDPQRPAFIAGSRFAPR